MSRAGFVALAGRPNVGKSTLVNAVVGAKVAIVSDKPQTTRRAIRGVATQDDWQMVLCDLPGVQRPRDELTTRMQKRVDAEIGDADEILMLVNGSQGVGGPGDRFIAQSVAAVKGKRRVTMAVNKVDRLDAAGHVRALTAAAELDAEFGLDAEIFPISARAGTGLDALVEHLSAALPEGPFLYGEDEVTDQRQEVWLAELVREQVLRRTRQEVPHAVEVAVDEVNDRGDVVIVVAAIWVEAESQKGILIGAGGKMIRDIGSAARKEIERETERHVHLDLSVRVRRSWRGDQRALDQLGIT
jgi:GTPase